MGFHCHQILPERLLGGHKMGHIRGDIPGIHLEAQSHLELGMQEERHSHSEVDKEIDCSLEIPSCYRCSTF